MIRFEDSEWVGFVVGDPDLNYDKFVKLVEGRHAGTIQANVVPVESGDPNIEGSGYSNSIFSEAVGPFNLSVSRASPNRYTIRTWIDSSLASNLDSTSDFIGEIHITNQLQNVVGGLMYGYPGVKPDSTSSSGISLTASYGFGGISFPVTWSSISSGTGSTAANEDLYSKWVGWSRSQLEFTSESTQNGEGMDVYIAPQNQTPANRTWTQTVTVKMVRYDQPQQPLPVTYSMSYTWLLQTVE